MKKGLMRAERRGERRKEGRKVEMKGLRARRQGRGRGVGCTYALYTRRHDGFVYTYIETVHDAGAAGSFRRYIRIAAAIKFYGRASQGERERERALFLTR